MSLSPPSQMSPHGAERVDLQARYGPVAALRRRALDAIEPRPTALLVPGYTGSKEDFAPLLDPIATAGFEAIAIDLPGQYESGGPDDESAYLPAALGAVLAELVGKLAAEGGPVMLLGHSFGGLVARAAILAGAPAAGLTLMDTGPSELPKNTWRAALEFGHRALRQDGLAAAHRLWQQFDSQDRRWDQLSPGVVDFLNRRFLGSKPASLLGMANGLMTEPDLTSELSRELRTRNVMCIVVCGEHDVGWAVSTQQEMAERLEADFAVISEARHSPAVENPTALLDILLTTWHTWLNH